MYASQHTGNPSVRLVRPAAADDQGALEQQQPPSTMVAEVVEHQSLRTVPVAPASFSSLSHFLDGIQRSHHVLYLGGVPVVWGYAAACIRYRDEQRLMRTFCQRSIDALCFSFSLVDRKPLEAFGFLCINSDAQQVPPLERHPDALKMLALEAVGQTRQRLETELMAEWSSRSSAGEWLLVDGPVSGFFKQGERKNIVGLIKSHRRRYFEGEDFEQVLALPEGHRTSVFRLPRAGREVGGLSWYLRLHTDPAADLTFGLVRVEAPIGDDHSAADVISSWVLAERCPLSLPDSRWHTMIYPIRDCEQYLRALAPTHTELEGRLALQVRQPSS